jgi:hypothetical protein
MNDQHPPLPSESVRLILIAAVVIAIFGGLGGLITAVGAAAVVLYFCGWEIARIRAAARSLVRTIIGE